MVSYGSVAPAAMQDVFFNPLRKVLIALTSAVRSDLPGRGVSNGHASFFQ
jgi:hypothetical protein